MHNLTEFNDLIKKQQQQHTQNDSVGNTSELLSYQIQYLSQGS
jgi:hypothetical protein